jgi:hypothetical protein
LQRHNLQNNGPCALCSQEVKTIHQLLLSCVYAKEVWFKLLRRAGLQFLTPVQHPLLADWWLFQRKRMAKENRKRLRHICLPGLLVDLE